MKKEKILTCLVVFVVEQRNHEERYKTRWARWTVLGHQDAIVTFQDGADLEPTYNLISRFITPWNMHRLPTKTQNTQQQN